MPLTITANETSLQCERFANTAVTRANSTKLDVLLNIGKTILEV